MKRDFLNVSNLLSISRILLIAPFLLITLSEIPNARLWGCLILAIGMLTDNLDGRLARKLHQETELGRILDPLADKLAVAALAITLLLLGAVPLWFAVALFTRDALILAGGIYLKAKRGIVVPSNTVGKWAVNAIVYTCGLALVGAPSLLVDIGIWTTVLMLVASLALYIKRFVEILGEKESRPA
jgi:CDP-diacylglycerol--glycerol-3-phosphate 3-phosphatidyltransferase